MDATNSRREKSSFGAKGATSGCISVAVIINLLCVSQK
jgi:hypothetical protein